MYTKEVIFFGSLAGYNVPQGVPTSEMTEAQQMEAAKYLHSKGQTSQLTDKGAALFAEKVYLCDEQQPEIEPELEKEKENVRTKKK
jgi:hypothetical protein